MDFSDTPGWRGWVMTDINAVAIALSTLFISIRIYVRARMTKNLGLNDAIATISYVFLIVQSAIDMMMVSLGSGTHEQYVPEHIFAEFYKFLGIQQLIYFWAGALVRLSILAFIPRIYNTANVMAMTYATSGVVMIQTIVCFVYKLAECTDIRFMMSNPRCKSASADDHMMVGHIAVGVVVDIILLFLPVWILYTKMLRSKRMTQGILVFCVGVLAVGLGITRLVINLVLDFTIDPTYKMAINGVFSDLEGHVGLWCGCFPAMSSIIKLVTDKLGLGSGRGNAIIHGSHSVNVGRRSAWKGADRGYEMKGLGVDREESDSQRSIVAAADRNAGESAQSVQWEIHQQTELTLAEETASTKDRDGDYTAHLRLSRNTDPGSP